MSFNATMLTVCSIPSHLLDNNNIILDRVERINHTLYSRFCQLKET